MQVRAHTRCLLGNQEKNRELYWEDEGTGTRFPVQVHTTTRMYKDVPSVPDYLHRLGYPGLYTRIRPANPPTQSHLETGKEGAPVQEQRGHPAPSLAADAEDAVRAPAVGVGPSVQFTLLGPGPNRTSKPRGTL